MFAETYGMKAKPKVSHVSPISLSQPLVQPTTGLQNGVRFELCLQDTCKSYQAVAVRLMLLLPGMMVIERLVIGRVVFPELIESEARSSF